jgi:hypothetical protein
MDTPCARPIMEWCSGGDPSWGSRRRFLGAAVVAVQRRCSGAVASPGARARAATPRQINDDRSFFLSFAPLPARSLNLSLTLANLVMVCGSMTSACGSTLVAGGSISHSPNWGLVVGGPGSRLGDEVLLFFCFLIYFGRRATNCPQKY